MEQLQRFADTISRISFDDSIYFMGIRWMPRNQGRENYVAENMLEQYKIGIKREFVSVCVWLLQTIKAMLFFFSFHIFALLKPILDLYKCILYRRFFDGAKIWRGSAIPIRFFGRSFLVS